MVACKLIISFLFMLLQVSVIVCKEDDGIIITLHRNEKTDLHAGLVQEDQKYEKLAKMVEATKNRARALKLGVHRGHGRVNKTGNNGSVGESLYARSFGGYSFKFSMGTPPQDLSLLMDTGSDLVWVPCTRNYTCIYCPEKRAKKSNGLFLPNMSSSTELLTCADRNCKTFYGKNTESFCGNCSAAKNCSHTTCPVYELEYGTGLTAGLLLSETLTLPLEDGRRAIKHFVVGCSLLSIDQPSGIAGFGRGALSMPSQLSRQHIIGKDRFAYCLQSHRFDEENKKSQLVLGDKAVPSDISLNYTPFLINSRAPPSSGYNSFYYVRLRGVSIGRKRLNLPSKLLRFDTKGHGGTIIDSGTTFTVFNKKIYEKIAAGFASQIGYKRATKVEAKTGMGLCYNISGLDNVPLPEFAFHFKGGSDMVLPVANYFSYFSSFDSICLTMISSEVLDSEVDNGPAVILGNYQQQNFYILFDREKNRLGFTQQTCKTFH
jgi:hypothetical protein